MLYEIADRASNAINPIFIIMILEEPLLPLGIARERFLGTVSFWGRVLLCMGVAVTLAEMGKAHQVWHGHPLFPSGHTTFATSAATCLILQRGKVWAYLCVPLAVLMGVSLAYGHWHTPDEVLGGWILGAVVPYLLWRLSTRQRLPKSTP
jgi:membrane-associated phospholipid phosphatase